MSGGDIAKTDGFLLWEDGLREPGTGGCLSAATLSWLFLWLLVLPVQSFFIIIIPCLSWWPLLEPPVTAQLQPDAHLKSTPAFQTSLLIWFSILFVCSNDRAAIERFCFWGDRGLDNRINPWSSAQSWGINLGPGQLLQGSLVSFCIL